MIASVQVVHDEKMLAVGADSVTASNSCCPIFLYIYIVVQCLDYMLYAIQFNSEDYTAMFFILWAILPSIFVRLHGLYRCHILLELKDHMSVLCHL